MWHLQSSITLFLPDFLILPCHSCRQSSASSYPQTIHTYTHTHLHPETQLYQITLTFPVTNASGACVTSMPTSDLTDTPLADSCKQALSHRLPPMHETPCSILCQGLLPIFGSLLAPAPLQPECGNVNPRWPFLNQEWAVLDKCSTLLTFWETIWRSSLCFPEAPTELSPYYQQQRLRIKSYIVFYYFSFLTVSFYSVLFTRFTVPFSAK